MRAYSESYLDDAMDNLGSMLDYAVVDCGFDADEFFQWFMVSGVAHGFESGNPRFITGMSGVELASEVHRRVFGEYLQQAPTQALDKSRAYWAGWSLAYYQWFRALRFRDMAESGLTPSVVMDSYILHEADISKFVETADAAMANAGLDAAGVASRLAVLRKQRGMTQRQLAEASGVTLRMVQLYEQGHNSLAKASVETVLGLARALGVAAEDLVA